MDNTSPLVANETYAAERKDDDFAKLRQAAIERADASSRHPTVALPGIVSVQIWPRRVHNDQWRA